ncbi:MAG: hypothetical protein FWF01_03455 [Alphaproteobacteria bacterium]|nr:hypothetical protein [Alphaproteobacteria bacterium]
MESKELKGADGVGYGICPYFGENGVNTGLSVWENPAHGDGFKHFSLSRSKDGSRVKCSFLGRGKNFGIEGIFFPSLAPEEDLLTSLRALCSGDMRPDGYQIRGLLVKADKSTRIRAIKANPLTTEVCFDGYMGIPQGGGHTSFCGVENAAFKIEGYGRFMPASSRCDNGAIIRACALYNVSETYKGGKLADSSKSRAMGLQRA